MTLTGMVLFTTFVLFLANPFAHAFEVFHGLSLCSPQDLTLTMQNRTREPQRVWTQVRQGADIDEIHWTVKPQSQLELQGSEFLDKREYFSLKASDSETLRARVSCKQGPSIYLSSLTTPELHHALPRGVRKLRLFLTSLYLRPQKVTVRAINWKDQVIVEKEEEIYNSYATNEFQWSLSDDIKTLEIRGQDRLASQVLFEQGLEEKHSPSFFLKPATMSPSKNKTYFLVSAKGQTNEAFVVGIETPEMIAKAREQIQNPTLEKIIVAGITLGNNNENRAFYKKDKSPYSWHVHRVDAFADFAHIDCDGSPDLVEERLEKKISEGGRICFWRYRVIRELSPDEIIRGQLQNRPKTHSSR